MNWNMNSEITKANPINPYLDNPEYSKFCYNIVSNYKEIEKRALAHEFQELTFEACRATAELADFWFSNLPGKGLGDEKANLDCYAALYINTDKVREKIRMLIPQEFRSIAKSVDKNFCHKIENINRDNYRDEINAMIHSYLEWFEQITYWGSLMRNVCLS